jgi:aminoglycoside phosphotransferase (APT) family kinase protein
MTWDNPNWLEQVQHWLETQLPGTQPIQPSHVWVGALVGLDLLPLALCHGDFHPMNVISPCGIIDWSDALIAHPFTDLERFLRWIMGNTAPHPWSPFPDARAFEREFVRAYLEPWTVFAPLPKLEQAFWQTRPFGLAVLLAQYAGFSGEGRSLVTFLTRQLARC